MKQPTLLEIMLEASGGIARWREVKSIYSEGSYGGWMVRMKAGFNRKLYKNLTTPRSLEAYVQEQKIIFHNYPTAGLRGVFDKGNVRIETMDGTEIRQERKNAKALFYQGWAGIRRFFYWDLLDFTYFMGYVFWNYFIAPYLFTYPGVKCREVAPFVNKSGEKFRVLEVQFPSDIGTHASKQYYYVDSRGLNVQMRYRLEIGRSPVMTWHNYITKYEKIDGLVLGTERRIFLSWDKLWREKRKNKVATLPIWGGADRTKLILFEEKDRKNIELLKLRKK